MNATMTVPTFSREDHPVGEITIPVAQRAASRASALVGYRLDGIAGVITGSTMVDLPDFLAYDTAS